MEYFCIVNKAGEYLTINQIGNNYTFTKNKERAYVYDTMDQALPVLSLFNDCQIKKEAF